MPNTVTGPLLAALGIRIRKLRIEKGLSLTSLAAMCDMQKATLSRIENGQVNISISTIVRLAQNLNVPISKITD